MDYLVHHGIKGQKHGIRRWQYKDGSLTPEGYPHYGYNGPRKKSTKVPAAIGGAIGLAAGAAATGATVATAGAAIPASAAIATGAAFMATTGIIGAGWGSILSTMNVDDLKRAKNYTKLFKDMGMNEMKEKETEYYRELVKYKYGLDDETLKKYDL